MFQWRSLIFLASHRNLRSWTNILISTTIWYLSWQSLPPKVVDEVFLHVYVIYLFFFHITLLQFLNMIIILFLLLLHIKFWNLSSLCTLHHWQMIREEPIQDLGPMSDVRIFPWQHHQMPMTIPMFEMRVLENEVALCYWYLPLSSHPLVLLKNADERRLTTVFRTTERATTMRTAIFSANYCFPHRCLLGQNK